MREENQHKYDSPVQKGNIGVRLDGELRMPDHHRTRRKVLLGFGILLNLCIVVMECIAFPMLWKEHPNLLHQAVFYTNQSNLLALVASLLYVLVGTRSLFAKDGRMPHWLETFKLMVTVQLYITFLVVAVGFVPVALSHGATLQAMYGGSMFVMHFLAPMVALVSFLFFEGTPRLSMKDTFWGVLYTYLYTAVMVPLNAMGIVNGPYPFLQVLQNPVWLSVVYAVTLLPGAYLVSLCGKLLHNGIASNIAGERRKE